jgi:hypothetical protein
MSLLLRCQFTGNPVGTDTRMFGADPCPCPGCKAHAEIERLRESGQSFQREAGRQCALRMEASEEVERAIDHGSAWPSLQGNKVRPAARLRHGGRRIQSRRRQHQQDTVVCPVDA